MGELGGLAHIAWVVTAYTLVTAVTTPIWGKLGDLYGRKRTYLAAVAIFVLGSAICGAAQSMTQLILARGLQGIGAGGIGAGAMALIGALVPPRERGRYQGMSASIMAIGTIAGPLLGGFVTDHLGWRWAFYVNLPVGIVAYVWLRRALHLPAPPQPASHLPTPHLPAQRARAALDWLGISLLTVAISAAVLAAGLSGAGVVVALLAVAAAALAAFILWQRRAAEPLIPLRVFTGHRNYSLGAAMVLLTGVVMFTGGLYLPLFQQIVQGASASNSGLLMIPLLIPIVVVSTIAGKIMSATGRYQIFPVLGGVFLTAGTALLATMGTDTSRLVTCLFMVLVGTGLGLTMQMGMTIAQNSVEMRDMGSAMSTVNLFRTLGASLAIAAFGSLFTRALAHPASYAHNVAAATHQIYLIVAVLCAAVFVLALAVKEIPLKKAGPAPAPASGPMSDKSPISTGG